MRRDQGFRKKNSSSSRSQVNPGEMVVAIEIYVGVEISPRRSMSTYGGGMNGWTIRRK